MTRTDLVDKWLKRFADNDTFEIDEADLREFTEDVAATFTEAGYQQFKELVLPQAVYADQWYVDGAGIWEARRSFQASVSPVSGPNWRQVVSFTGQSTQVVTAASITDATDAGRKLLKAPSAAAQRALLSNPAIQAGQYGTHPGWDNTDKPGGLYEWLIQKVLTLQASQPQPVSAPLAPTAGQVDDTADTFSFLPNPAFPSFAQYKVNGLPGVTGAVVLDSANSYVQGSRIYLKVVGAVAKGGLAVYVAGSGNVPDGAVLTNADPFTGVAVMPTPALTAALAISVASILVGSPLTFTVTAGGGTAPYSYAVVATHNSTGATTVLGSSATGSFTPTVAGTYNIDATVTDAAGKLEKAITRIVQVTSPVNRIPVADAGSDLTIQLPTSSVALMGTASDPDQGDTLTYAWRQITGPGNATGLPATTLNVVASNLVAGTYQFGFRSTDNHGAQSAEDYVLVTVQAAVGKPKKLVGVGNSLMSPLISTTGRSPFQLAVARLNQPGLATAQIGHPGESIQNYLDSHMGEIQAAYDAAYDCTLLVELVTNDLNASHIDTIKAAFATFCAQVKAIGYKNIVWSQVAACQSPFAYARDSGGAIIGGNDVPARRQGFDTARLAWNAYLASRVGNELYAVADLSIYSAIYPMAQALDERYYNPAGQGPYAATNFGEPGGVHWSQTYGVRYAGEAWAQACAKALGYSLSPATIAIPDAPVGPTSQAIAWVNNQNGAYAAPRAYKSGGAAADWDASLHAPFTISRPATGAKLTVRAPNPASASAGSGLLAMQGSDAHLNIGVLPMAWYWSRTETNVFSKGGFVASSTPHNGNAGDLDIDFSNDKVEFKRAGSVIYTVLNPVYPYSIVYYPYQLAGNDGGVNITASELSGAVLLSQAAGGATGTPLATGTYPADWTSASNGNNTLSAGVLSRTAGAAGWLGYNYSGLKVTAPPAGFSGEFAHLNLPATYGGSDAGSVLVGFQVDKAFGPISKLKHAPYADALTVATYQGTSVTDKVDRNGTTPVLSLAFTANGSGAYTALYYRDGSLYGSHALDLSTPLYLVAYLLNLAGDQAQDQQGNFITLQASQFSGVTLSGSTLVSEL